MCHCDVLSPVLRQVCGQQQCVGDSWAIRHQQRCSEFRLAAATRKSAEKSLVAPPMRMHVELRLGKENRQLTTGRAKCQLATQAMLMSAQPSNEIELYYKVNL